MPRDGRIIDIRYYEGASHDHLGSAIYGSLKWSTWVGDRIGRRLRELGFMLGKSDHVYICLQPVAPAHQVALTPLGTGPASFARSVAYNLDPAEPAGLAPAERDALLADCTCRTLHAIDDGDGGLGQHGLIDRVRRELAESGRDLEVSAVVHETGSYRLEVSHRLAPLRSGSLGPIRPPRAYIAFLRVTDKRSGATGGKAIFEFANYDELHSSVGALSIRAGVVRIKPRRGHNFDVPIDIPLSEVFRS